MSEISIIFLICKTAFWIDCKVVHACWKYELDPSQGEAEN